MRERRSYLVDVPAERFDDLDGRLSADDGLPRRSRELDALTICVPTPLSKTRTPDLSYIVSAAESVAAHLRHGQLVVLQSTTYPGTTEEVVLPILERRRRARRRRLLPRLRARARRSGQRAVHDPEHAEARRGRDRRVPAAARELLYRADRGRRSSRVVQRDGRGDREAAREHLPRGQHRAGERAGADVRQARHLRLGGDRGGRDQAVRLPPALPRPRASGGDCIPVVPHFLAWRLREYGYSAQLHRGGARDQRAACPRTSSQKVGDALNEAGKPIEGLAILLLGHGVQGERPRHPRVAEPRGPAPAHSCAAATCATAIRGSTRSSSTACSTAASTGPPSEVAEADCVVLLTPHGEFLEQPLWEHAPADRRHAQRRPGRDNVAHLVDLA